MNKLASILFITTLIFWGCGNQNLNQVVADGNSNSVTTLINSDLVGKKFYELAPNGFTCGPFGPSGSQTVTHWSDKLEFQMINGQLQVIHYGNPCNDIRLVDPFVSAKYKVSADQKSLIFQEKVFIFKPNDSF